MKYNKLETKTQNDSGHSNDFKIRIHSFPAGRSALKGSVENKPASLLVVPLGKTFSGIPPSWCGKEMAGNSSASSYSVLIAFSWQGG